MGKQKDENNKIISVDIDETNLPLPSHEALQERKVAIFDLLTENFLDQLFLKTILIILVPTNCSYI